MVNETVFPLRRGHPLREAPFKRGKQLQANVHNIMCVRAKSLQSCLTLCDPMGHSPPGSSVHGILQARILEWVSAPFSRGSSWPRDRTCVSYVYLRWQARSLPLVPPKKPVIDCKKILLGILQRWLWTSFSQAFLWARGARSVPGDYTTLRGRVSHYLAAGQGQNIGL